MERIFFKRSKARTAVKVKKNKKSHSACTTFEVRIFIRPAGLTSFLIMQPYGLMGLSLADLYARKLRTASFYVNAFAL